jgi:hypothetical protein
MRVWLRRLCGKAGSGMKSGDRFDAIFALADIFVLKKPVRPNLSRAMG